MGSGLFRPDLPIELFPEILSFLPFDPKGRRSLLQCCRVSKKFYAIARPHLFTIVDFGTASVQDYRKHDITLFQNVLCITPSLAKDVRYIAFPSTEMQQYADLLVSLVSLQGLSIESNHDGWDDIPPMIQTMLVHTVFPRLSTLRIASMDMFPVPDVLPKLSNIQELFFSYTTAGPVGDPIGHIDYIHPPRFRCLILEGYDDDDLNPRFFLRSMLTHSQCKLDTLVLKGSSTGDILNFLSELCLGSMTKHLRTMYLSEDFFRNCQFYGFGNERSLTVTFFDLLAVPNLEHLHIEVPVHGSVFEDSNLWEQSACFFHRLAEILGYGRESWGRNMPLRSINFVTVESDGTWEPSQPLDSPWRAFDGVLVNNTLLPMLEKVTFEKGYENLDVLKSLLPRALDAGLLCFGEVAQSLTIWC
ncbi:hypothetical protein DL96DRAFT_1710550 [Flagelloscypha sp. PMI_526]|nr:hypothetical protein DL96DRAFT_1710550 [Flagelloscypha sp. PMI_526]